MALGQIATQAGKTHCAIVVAISMHSALDRWAWTIREIITSQHLRESVG